MRLKDPRHGPRGCGPALSGRDSKTCRSWSASPVEIGDQQLDTGGRGLSSLMARTVSAYSQAPAVGQVVAGHTGDRGVPQAHRLHTLGDPAWFRSRVERRAGLPVSIWQKKSQAGGCTPQPPIRKVASRSSQHS